MLVALRSHAHAGYMLVAGEALTDIPTWSIQYNSVVFNTTNCLIWYGTGHRSSIDPDSNLSRFGHIIPHPELVVWAAEGCRHVLYSCDTPEIQLLYSVVLNTTVLYWLREAIRRTITPVRGRVIVLYAHGGRLC